MIKSPNGQAYAYARIYTPPPPQQHLSTWQAYAYAGREDVARLVHGGVGNLLKRRFYTPVDYNSYAQRRRALGYASKLQACYHRD